MYIFVFQISEFHNLKIILIHLLSVLVPPVVLEEVKLDHHRFQGSCSKVFAYVVGMNRLDRSVLRSLLRVAGRADIFFQPNLHLNEFQTSLHHIPVNIGAYLIGPYFCNLPLPIVHAMRSSCNERLITTARLQDAIRRGFRTPLSIASDSRHDVSYFALRLLSEQSAQTQRSSITLNEEHNIRVICSTLHSPAGRNDDIFLYRITIENLSDVPIEVHARSWTFIGDDNFSFDLPKWSPGLIGLVPVVGPKLAFHYMSCTSMPCKKGSMSGALLAKNLDTGETFELQVGHCPLAESQSSTRN
jgi:uncharacterized protein affecting Mg2+/Co2+ transport